MKDISRILALERKTSKLSRRRLFELNEKLPLHSSQVFAIVVLGHNDGCAQNELAKRLNISAPTAGSSIKKLEAGGFVYRKSDAEDARKTRVYLTERGREVFEQAEQNLMRVYRMAFVDFTEEELQIYTELMERAAHNLSQEFTRESE